MDEIVTEICEYEIFSPDIPGPDIFIVGGTYSRSIRVKVELHDDHLLITGPSLMGKGPGILEVPFSEIVDYSWEVGPLFPLFGKATLSISMAFPFREAPFSIYDIDLSVSGFSYSKLRAMHDAIMEKAPVEGSERRATLLRYVREDREALQRLIVSKPKKRKKRGK